MSPPPYGDKCLIIHLTVATQYRRVTDGQTDILRQHNPRYAYESRGKNDRKLQIIEMMN